MSHILNIAQRKLLIDSLQGNTGTSVWGYKKWDKNISWQNNPFETQDATTVNICIHFRFLFLLHILADTKHDCFSSSFFSDACIVYFNIVWRTTLNYLQ